MSSNSFSKELQELVAAVYKESSEVEVPSSERCGDILLQIETLTNVTAKTSSQSKKVKNRITIAVLESTQIGQTLGKCKKAIKRHRRSADTMLSQENNPSSKNEWEEAFNKCESILTSWKQTAKLEADDQAKKKRAKLQNEQLKILNEKGRPTSVPSLHARLKKQKKEIYKDPPVLPPPKIVIFTTDAPKADRCKNSGELIFSADDKNDCEVLKAFRPNLSPAQILQGGAFGGTYYRSITSAVTNESYPASQVLATSLEPEWIKNLNPKLHLTSQTYRPAVNKYKAKCGGSLGMWESSGWISDVDPYGWFQWYCRFYSGRRCSDDERQIGRWSKIAGPKGRFLSQLCNKCLKANKKAGDTSVSPVIRQTLWHWGLVLTEGLLKRHQKRISSR